MGAAIRANARIRTRKAAISLREIRRFFYGLKFNNKSHRICLCCEQNRS